MGPKYDNRMYPNIKPFTVEDYMKEVASENLGGANFLWENKTVRAPGTVEVALSNGAG